MNFVAHFFLDQTHENSSFAIGAATPDLLSIFNSKNRIKKSHILKVDFEALSEDGKALYLGVNRHFHADRVFHSSEFFLRQTKSISEDLATFFPEGNVPRKYFIAHVLLELVLDKVIIDQDPTILDRYYSHFEKMAPFDTIASATELLSGQDLPNYAQFIQKFLQNRYLTQYRKWDHILYVLGRIMRRVGIAEQEFLEDERMLKLMIGFEERLKKDYLAIFQEIRDEPERIGH